MYRELTNLLPEERARRLRREYFVRLATIAIVFLVVLTVTASALLLPVYVYLKDKEREKEAALAEATQQLFLSDEETLRVRLSGLNKKVTRLQTLEGVPSLSAIVRDVLDVDRSGITLSGLSLAQATGAKPGTVAITGTAATRDRLRAYQLALLATPFVKAADLPISAYAKDADISFTITVTLAPTL